MAIKLLFYWGNLGVSLIPKFPKHFWFYFSNTHQEVSSKSLLGCRVRFFRPQIPKGRFGFGPNCGLLKSRCWRSGTWGRRMMKMERNNGDDDDDDFKINLMILK
ncbi:hypothetical protein ERO13_D08G108308v2 [Gossypium hirsutum]|uniref:Uncharacterized protein n=2 Tax=Gossypium TaxID=3633 RepID=A0A5J5QEU5_GOSBA|nr:hypothetical protein ES319_D08G124700v1 [Gossypium barbadense]KAG4133829.1 hypothetical protein ERO13_D08G108308v2 [Gossypium hirsutum]TYG57315.1 hypothetical protein ES288_D08G132500v1 [Gossypium darwinii]